MRNGDLISKNLDTWEVIDPVFEEDDMGGEYLTGYMLRRDGDPKATLVFFGLLELDVMLGGGWTIIPKNTDDP